MTKKIIKIVHFFLLLFISATLSAQRTPRERAEFTYVRLPLSPLNENIKTYEIKATLIDLAAEDNREKLTQTIRNSFKLHGYEKVNDEGDIQFEISLNPCHVIKLHHEKSIKKEKQGDKNVDVTYYYYNVELRYPISLSISDVLGTNYKTQDYINNSNDYQYVSSPTFKTATERNKWWNENRQSFVQDWKNKQLEANLNIIKKRVESLYALTPTRVFESVYTASKRKVDYSDLDKAQEIAILAYKSINVNDGFGDSFKTQIDDAITAWKSVLTQFEPNNKKARINPKVAIALHKNLAIAYYWLGDFEQAAYYVEQEALLDRKNTWSNNFTKQIVDRKTRLDGGKQDADDEDEDEYIEEDDDDDEE